MIYVLKGWARVYFEGTGKIMFKEGTYMYQEPGIHHRVIEITSPADFETVSIAP